MPLERRVGGTGRGGSTVQLYALDTAGQRVLAQRQAAAGNAVRVRRPGTPGERTVRHMTAVAQLFVDLVALGRAEGFAVADYLTEPACWWPSGLGGYVKPDAYLCLTTGAVRDHWWAEVDNASEGLPTIQRKLLVYLDFLRRGQIGPGGVMPRVLISAITEKRRDDIRLEVRQLPPPAGELFAVEYAKESARYLRDVLRQ
ncbi:replication-relaxation family protein [Actinomadura formosensis]|uniref:replication-relaxation family protein n=2 Tax=Actinomadura formosensis TaxID=60706 RepID=UPI0013F177F5|nr:replication-relaxation family protein [Actinomadura formosensis]